MLHKFTLISLLVLTACASDARLGLIHTCEAWIGTKNTLATAIMADRVNAEAISTVEELVPVADGFCSGPLPASNDLARVRLASVQAAIDAAVLARTNSQVQP